MATTSINEILEGEDKVLSWWDDADEYWCVGYKGLINHTGMTKEQLKPIITSLKAKGFLEYYKGLTNDEGEMGGAGWGLTQAGRDAYFERQERLNDLLTTKPTLDTLRLSKAQKHALYTLIASKLENLNPRMVDRGNEAYFPDTAEDYRLGFMTAKYQTEHILKELFDE